MGRCKQKQRRLRGLYVAGPPLLNGRCTSLLRVVVSEMTYTVLSGTLNFTIPYHTIPVRCFLFQDQNGVRRRKAAVEPQNFADGAVMIIDQDIIPLHCLMSSRTSATYCLQI